MTEEKIEEKTIKAFCSECSGDRNCNLLGKKIRTLEDRYTTAWTHWYLLECCGCDHVFAYKKTGHSEDYTEHYDDEFDHYIEIPNEVKSYWPAISKRKLPSWMMQINQSSYEGIGELEEALSELYGALDNDLNMLAGIGIRTCFDKASELLGIESSLRFEEKLTALVEGGRIGKVDMSHLETIIDAGSASAHRGWKPSSDDLAAMMDVLKNFLERAFIAPIRAENLKSNITRVKGRVPPKPARTKKEKVLSSPTAKPTSTKVKPVVSKKAEKPAKSKR